VAALKSKADGAKPDLAKYVPKAVYEEAQAQLAALKAGGDTKEIEQLIEQGLADGRIAGKATADWLREQGLAALKAHMEDSPAIAALKATQTNGKKPEGSEDEKDKDKLTAEELAVCKAMGLSPEDYKKANATS
jgi:phage I-like protein